MPLGATSGLSPRRGEGAGKANGGCESGGAIRSLPLAAPLTWSVPMSDGSVGGGWVEDGDTRKGQGSQFKEENIGVHRMFYFCSPGKAPSGWTVSGLLDDG